MRVTSAPDIDSLKGEGPLQKQMNYVFRTVLFFASKVNGFQMHFVGQIAVPHTAHAAAHH